MGAVYDAVTVDTQDVGEAEHRFASILDRSRAEKGMSYSGAIGMATGLTFVPDKAFANEDEADDWLSEHAQKYEDALAVRIPGGWRIGANCSS